MAVDKLGFPILKGLDDNNRDQSSSLADEQSQIVTPKLDNPDVSIPNHLSGGTPIKEKDSKDIFSDIVSGTEKRSAAVDPTRGGLHSAADIPGEAKSRYGTYYGEQTENLYGESQSGWEKAAYAVPRVLGNFTKTVVQGVTAPLVGLGYLATGGNFVKNDYNDFLENFQKKNEDAHPLYVSDKEKNASFLGQIKYGDSWVHLGEFIGMGAGIATTAWMTGGASEAALGAMDVAQGSRITANYLGAIDKLAESTSVISKLENSTEVGSALIEKANAIWSQSISEGEKLDQLTAEFSDISKKYASRMTNLGANKQRVYGAASMLGMNAGMGSQANTQFAQSLIQEIKDKEHRDATPEEKEKIKNMADAVGQWTFGLGTVMSTFSFHGLLKGMIGKDAEKAVMNEINGITEKEGVYAAKKAPFGVEKGEGWMTKAPKIAGNKLYQAGKFAGKFVDPWAGVGLTEFSLMGPSVENYFNKKYHTGKADLIQDAIGPNVDKIFTKDGMSTFFMGMLGAGPMELKQKLGESKEKALNTKAAIDAFNNNTAKTFLNANMESIIRDKALNETEQGAVANNDEFTKYNTREQRLINYIFPRVKYGMSSTIGKELKEYREQLSSPEGIEKLQKEFNIDGKPEDVKKQLTSYFDHMEDMATKMESNYKAVSMRYGRVPGFNDVSIEKLLYLSQMTDNATGRISKLADELQTDPNLQSREFNPHNENIFATPAWEYNPTQDIASLLAAESRSTIIRGKEGEKSLKSGQLYDKLQEQIDNLSVTDDKKAELKQKLEDLVRLNATKRQYLRQYHDITSDPAKHSKDREFKIINPYTEGLDEDQKFALDNTLNPTIEDIETKTGKKTIETGVEYYAGSPVTASTHDAKETGFRKFKVIKEITDGEDAGKILIQTEKGDRIPVDKDFFKDHKIDKTSNMSPKAKFYDRIKLKRLKRTLGTKEERKAIKRQEIDAKISGLEEDRRNALNDSQESHKDRYDDLVKQLDQINKVLSEGKASGKDKEDLDRQKKDLVGQLTRVNGDIENEAKRIHDHYQAEIKRHEDIAKELDKDPRDYLKGAALDKFNAAREAIKAVFSEELKKLHDQKEQNPNTDVDFEKSKLEEKRDKKLADLRVATRDELDTKLKDLQKQDTEAGTMQYSPETDTLHFVNDRGEKTDIDPEDIKKGSISKMDGTPWSEEDKTVGEGTKKAQEKEKFDKLGEVVAGDQERSKNTFLPTEKPLTSEPGNLKATKKEVDKELGVELNENGIPKKTIQQWFLSSVPSADGTLGSYFTKYNNWVKRAETFFQKLTNEKFQKSSDLKWTTGSNKGEFKPVQVLYVHANNQDALGLSGLIDAESIKNYTGEKSPIMMVMVHVGLDDDPKSSTFGKEFRYTVTNEGKRFKKLGVDQHTHDEKNPENSDYNKIVFSYLQPAVTTHADGKTKGYRTTIEGTPDEIKAKEADFLTRAKKYRTDILNGVYNDPYNFSISNSIPETYSDHNQKTAIDQTGLQDKPIATGDIQVATLGTDNKSSITIPGIDGKGRQVNVNPGWAYWIRRGAVELLNRMRFTPSHADHIYKCIEYLCKDLLKTGKLNSKMRDYLSSVTFFNSQYDHKDGKVVMDALGFPSVKYDGQIGLWNNPVEGPNKGVWLLLGKGIKIPFNSDAIGEDSKNTITNRTGKQEIIEFISKLNHSVLNKKLKDNTEYVEITGFDKNGQPIDKVWKNYTEYLTSSTDPDGNKRGEDKIPLTTNIVKALPDANGDLVPNAKGKYITVKPTVQEKEVPANTKKPEAKKSEPIKTATPEVKLNGEPVSFTEENTYKSAKVGDIVYTAKFEDGKVIPTVISVNDRKPSEISEAINDPDATPDQIEQLKQDQKNINNITAVLTKMLKAAMPDEIVPEIVPVEEVKPEEKPIISQENPVEAKNKVESVREAAKKKNATVKKGGRAKKNMEVTPGTYPIENIAGFKDWLGKVLPQFSVEDFPELIKNGKSGLSWGQFDPMYRRILLSQQGVEGVGFHEAFHAVFDSFLSPKVQQKLVNEFRNRKGEFSNRWGDVIDFNHPNLTEEEIIEQLADEFRYYNMDKKVYEKEPVKMSFFKRLKNFLKNWIEGKPARMINLFDKINAGNFKDASVYISDPTKKDMEVFPNGKTAKQNLVRDFQDGFFEALGEHLGIRNGNLIAFAEGHLKASDVFNSVKEDLNEKLLNPYNYTVYDNSTNDYRDVSDEEVDGFYNSMDFLTKDSTDENGDPIKVIDETNWDQLIKNNIEPKLKLFKVSLKTEKVSEQDKTEQEKVGGDAEIENISNTPDEETQEYSSKNTYDKQTFQTDAKDTAPAEIQFLFNTLFQTIQESVPKYNSELEIPALKPSALLLGKMVEDNSLFYKTMHNLSGCTSLDEMQSRFAELAKRVPNLVSAYDVLFGTESDDRNLSQWKILLMAHKTFAKQTPEALYSTESEDGNVYYRQSDSAKVSDQIYKQWESGFKDNKDRSSQVEVRNPNDQNDRGHISYIINPKLPLIKPGEDKIFDFLEQIGFTAIDKSHIDVLDAIITDPTVSKFEKKEAQKLKHGFIDEVQSIYDVFIKAQANKTPLKGRDFAGVGTRIRKVCEIAAQVTRDKFQSQYLRPDGENVQKNINHNYYSRLLGDLNECKTLDALYERHPEYKTDPYVQNSLLLKKGGQFFDEEGKLRGDLRLTVNNGHKNTEGKATSTDDMTGVQRALSYLNGIISDVKNKGIFNVFMPADQATDFGMKIKHYISKTLFKDSPTKAMERFHGAFHGYLEDEINLIKDSANRNQFQDLAKKVNDPINDVQGKTVSQQLRFFKNILLKPGELSSSKNNLVKLITEYANGEGLSKDLSFKDFMKSAYDPTIDINSKDYTTIGARFEMEIDKYLDKELNRELSYFIQNLIVTGNDQLGYKFEGLNTDLLQEFGHTANKDGDYKLNRSDIMQILKFRMLNAKINTVEFSKLFYGDPANYKDFLKRAKLFNSATETTYMDRSNTGFNKYANRELNKVGKKLPLKATDWGYHPFDNEFTGITFNHGDTDHTKTVPANIEELKGMFKESLDNKHITQAEYDSIIKAYENGNSIDAQSYATIRHIRELGFKSGGVWKENHETLFQHLQAIERWRLHTRLEAGEKGLAEKLGRKTIYDTKKDGTLSAHGKKMMQIDEILMRDKLDEKKYEGLLNIVKYLGAGQGSDENMVMTNGLKTSTFPLFYDVNMEGSKLEDLYFFMQKKNIDYAGPESQHKFGRRGISPDLYNTGTTELANIGDIALHNLDQSTIDQASYKMPMDQFNKIVETAANHEKTTMGSQLRVLATMDLMDNGIPKDFYNADEGHLFHEKEMEWNKLSELEKREKSDLYGIHKDMNNVLAAMVKQGGGLVQETLGIKTGKDGKPYLADPKKLQSYLMDMCNTYNIPDNIKKALRITEDVDGKKTILIDQLPNRDSLEYIIHSVIEKHIVRPKINGGSKILVSGDMFEKNNKKAIYRDSDGNWQKVTDENFKKLQESGTPMMLTNENLNFYTFSKDGKTLTGMEVMVNNHFKEEMRAWAKKNGKDLVTDQELLNYLNKPENEELLKGIGFRIPTQGLNSVDAFRIKGFVSDRLGDAVVVPAEITTKVGSDFDVDKLNTYLKNFEINEKTGLPEVVKYDSKKEAHENSQEALHNKYMDLLEKVLLHPDNKTRLLTPNTTKIFTDLEKEIAPIKHVSEEKDKSINYANQLDTLWVNRKRQEFLEGKALTSIAASANTAHAMFQNMNIYLKNNLTIKLNHNQITMGDGTKVTSFSQVKNIKGQYISDLLSQIINGTVDVANDSWLMRLLPSKSVFSQTIFLLRAGVDPKEALYFINQPIIQEYIKLKDKNANLPSDQKKFKTNKALVAYMLDLLDSFKGGDESDVDKFSLDAMKTSLEDWHKYNPKYGIENQIETNKLSTSQNVMQRQVLREFLKYEGLANEMLVAQQGAYWGNVKKPTDGLVYLKNNSYEKGTSEESNIGGIKEGMESTWFGALRDEIKKQSDTLSSTIFKTALPQAKRVLEPIYNYIANLRIEGGTDAKERLISRAKSNFIDFLVQNFSRDKGEALNSSLKKMFVEDKENLQHRLMVIQAALAKMPETELAKNSVLNKLIGIPKASPTDPHNIEIDAKPTTVNSKDDFTSSLEELNDHPGIIDPETKQPIDIKQFVQDLYKFGLLQSGIRKSRISYNDLIPESEYSKHVSQGMNALEDNNSTIKAYDDLKVFWRTNFKDDNIVPKEYKSPIQILNSGERFVSLPKYRASSPVIKVVKPFQVKDKTSGKMRDMNKAEIAERRNQNRGENLYETRLFQRVEYPDGSHFEKINGKYTNVIYKEINAWGDGQYMQEHYTEAQPSILDKNIHVNELSHEEFMRQFEKGTASFANSGLSKVVEDEETEDPEVTMAKAQEDQYLAEEEARKENPDNMLDSMQTSKEEAERNNREEEFSDEENEEFGRQHEEFLKKKMEEPGEQPESSPCPGGK